MPRPKRFTINEYLTIERKAETKSEYCDGMILAMAGGLPDHNFIGTNIAAALWHRLRAAASCRVINSDQRVAVAQGEALYYPDVTVVCGDLKMFGRNRDVIANPILVVEVLSRSITGYDRLVKVPQYQRTPSMADILLVSQDKARVEHLTRIGKTGKWKTTTHASISAIVELPSIACSLPLADVYLNIDL